MLKHKKNRSSLDEIGRTCFDFDVKLEKNIYRYLCCIRVKGKNLRKLDEKVRFESYKQWKQYVCNKYKDYSKNKLIEFSRYLNQKMRNIKPYHEYWNIIAAAILTLGTTKILDVTIGTLNEVSETTFWKIMILVLFIELFFWYY